jgi:anthranilate phosphoribosyltransferase
MGAVLEALHKVTRREHLSEQEAADVLGEILRGEATPALISGLLVALRMKGETVDEVVGFARAMRAAAAKIELKSVEPASLVDTCGTGGDGRHSFNISTASAFVVAGAGVPVAKHGNRSISSRCGSADVLEALGAAVALQPEQVARCIESVGIGFLFAPLIHPAMKHAQPTRAELKMRTVFNLLGPLTNPAGAGVQVVGVFDGTLLTLIAEALARLGVRRAFVVHGEDGLDEITTTGPTLVREVAHGEVIERVFHPEDFGLPLAQPRDLAGGDAVACATILRSIVGGEQGPRRNVVLANAAAALVAAERAQDLREGASLAAAAIDSGRAKKVMEEFVLYTSQFKQG